MATTKPDVASNRGSPWLRRREVGRDWALTGARTCNLQALLRAGLGFPRGLKLRFSKEGGAPRKDGPPMLSAPQPSPWRRARRPVLVPVGREEDYAFRQPSLTKQKMRRRAHSRSPAQSGRPLGLVDQRGAAHGRARSRTAGPALTSARSPTAAEVTRGCDKRGRVKRVVAGPSRAADLKPRICT